MLTDAASVEHSSDRNGWLSQEATQYLLADLALYSNDYQGAIDDGNKVLSKSNDIYFTSEGLNSLWSKNTYSGRIFAFNNNSSYYAGIQYSSQEVIILWSIHS